MRTTRTLCAKRTIKHLLRSTRKVDTLRVRTESNQYTAQLHHMKYKDVDQLNQSVISVAVLTRESFYSRRTIVAFPTLVCLLLVSLENPSVRRSFVRHFLPGAISSFRILGNV
jgi:hypothetical protein